MTPSLKGSLSDLSIFDLYRHLYLSRSSGILQLQRGEVQKEVYFRLGSVVFATTNQDSERLGLYFLNHGKITREQMDALIEESRSGKRFGQAVVEHGFLTQDEVRDCVCRHQRDVIVATLQWEGGSFAFYPGQSSEFEDVLIDLSTADLILEGVRGIDAIDRIRRLLGDQGVALRLTSDPLLRFQRISLNPQEAYVFSRVDGTTSIEEICQISALDEPTTLRVVLGLILTGILEHSVTRGDGKPEVEFLPDVSLESAPGDKDKEMDASLAEEIRRLALEFKTATLYEILQAPCNATPDDLKRAYFRLAKRLHPDLYSHSAPPDLLHLGESVFHSIRDAYKILTDPVQRTQYDERLGSHLQQQEVSQTEDRGQEQRMHKSVQAIARRAFEAGVKDYESGDYPSALEKFREAVRADGDVAPYRYYLARTLARLPQRMREAQIHFQLAIQQAPWNVPYYVELGELYVQAGLAARARACFEKACELDPKQRKVVGRYLPRREGANLDFLSRIFRRGSASQR